MNDLIAEAASIIREYNAPLANAFVARPFSRVDLARAFAAGFVSSPEEDIHPAAALVLRIAYADKERRRLAA